MRRDDVSRPVMITCAVTGSFDTVSKNSAVPVSPIEIAQSALDAAAAGAAIVHIHVRDPDTGDPSMNLGLYREVVERIHEQRMDTIINLTTGPGGRFVPGLKDLSPQAGTTLVPPAERIAHVQELNPDICSLDVATMNFGEAAFLNVPAHLRFMAERIREAGVVPELEVFEPGHIRLARKLMDEELVDGPGLFQICLGIDWSQPATPEAMLYMRSLLPKECTWFAFGTGPTQFPMVAQAILLGGNVRVGLEDNLYMSRGVLAPSNAALVERAVKIIESMGYTVATPTEARKLLGLRQAL